MTKFDLFAAVGQLDDKYLESGKTYSLRKKERKLTRIALIAAIVLSLMAGVMAVSCFINTAGGTGFELVAQEGGYGGDLYSVTLDTKMSQDAPEKITTHCVPRYMEGCEKWTHVDIDYNENVLHMAWDNYEDTQYVLYSQIAAPYYDGTYYLDTFRVPAGTVLTKSTIMVDGQQVVCIESLPNDDGYTGTKGEKRFYWSDGMYLFSISCTASVNTGEITEIIKSVAPVENISAYEKAE